MGRACNRHGKKRNKYRILVGNSKGLGRSGSERITLEWILVRYDGMVWTGLIWLRIGTSGGFL
jgi:hypothetical protein